MFYLKSIWHSIFFNETPNELFLKGDELQANQEKNLSINFIQFYYF